jgi:hypothetical protein
MMKTGLLVLCLLCASTAFAQASLGSAAMSSQVQFAVHDERATQLPLAQEQSLLANSSYFFALGERPLWEVQPLSHAVPLGDVARMLKKEHETAKKAEIVWNN